MRRTVGVVLGRVTLFVAGLVAFRYLYAYTDLGLRTLLDRYPGQAAGGFVLAVATPFLIVSVNRRRSARAMARHAEESGWKTVDPLGREWPWTDLRLRGTITVLRAWSFESGGFPITAGEVRWTGNALAGAVTIEQGRGVFAVVHLPVPVPSMAMRNRFDRIGESPLLDRSALRLALLNGEIPPWTARGRTLFTIEPPKTWIRPATVEEVVRRAVHVVELLDLNGAV